MKKIFFSCTVLFIMASAFYGCKDQNYPGGEVSPYFPLYDLRKLYKGSDVTLTTDIMFSSNSITGVVISDHSGNNLPAGLLIIQERRRLDSLRGIAIQIGADAAKYVPGDSVKIKIDGAVLKRLNGTLQITGVDGSAITKVASGRVIPPNRVGNNLILAKPGNYESTLVAVVKGSFDPVPAPTDVLAGDKVINDGFDNITLHTETNATFANQPVAGLANYFGIVFMKQQTDGKLVPEHRLRKGSDVVVLSSTVETTAAVISGFMADPKGGDPNYEYVQLLATQDINFAVTPFSVIVNNNAGAAQPGGVPNNGWVSGGTVPGQFRTYKFALTSGTVAKGQFFYVGGTGRLINASGSTSMSSSKWIRTINYTTTAGDDGIGLKTDDEIIVPSTGKTTIYGLMANSGNCFGIALFNTRNVTKDTKPIDVVFTHSGGTVYSAAPPEAGYLIPNNDFYDTVNPITLVPQPFYRSGTNTLHLGSYPTSDQGYFNKLGGIYSATLGKWVKARSRVLVELTKTSAITEIETANGGPDVTAIK